MEDFWYIFAAFGFVWVLVFGFVLFLVIKQNKLQKDLDSIKGRLTESEKRK